MRNRSLGHAAAITAAVVLVAACSSGTGSTPPPGGGGASSAPAAGQAAGGGGSGADAGSLNACSFLTTDDIKAAVGWSVAAGVVQNSNGQTDCTWNSAPDNGSAVGLTISNFDANLWQAGSTAGMSTAVSGIGDAAFKGWPHAGTLTIKDKSYMVAVSIIDFQAAPTTLDAENLALAKIVLPHL